MFLNFYFERLEARFKVKNSFLFMFSRKVIQRSWWVPVKWDVVVHIVTCSSVVLSHTKSLYIYGINTSFWLVKYLLNSEQNTVMANLAQKKVQNVFVASEFFEFYWTKAEGIKTLTFFCLAHKSHSATELPKDTVMYGQGEWGIIPPTHQVVDNQV